VNEIWKEGKAHILPYAWFLVCISAFGWLQTKFGAESARYWGYAAAYGGALLFLLIFRKQYAEINFRTLAPEHWKLALIVGAVAIFVWILPYHLAAEGVRKSDSVFGWLGKPREALKPGDLPGALGVAFFVLRAIGYCFITPVFEELFVRSFLNRYMIQSDFRKVSFSDYDATSFWVSVGWFALSHPEWLVAAMFSIMLQLLLYRTRRFETCVIAHVVANVALVIYVVATGRWDLW